MKFFDDYIRAVLNDYHKKKSAGTLSLNLSHPSQAKLKRESLLVFQSRFRPKDHLVINNFLGEAGEMQMQATFLAMKKCDADRFKPLVNYLKGSTNKTDEKNIALLAWLIDYEPRPFIFGGMTGFSAESGSEKGKGGNELEESVLARAAVLPAGESPTNQYPLITRDKLPGKRMVVIVGVTVLALAVIGFFLIRSIRKSPGRLLTGIESCMYWSGEHYEPISCSQKIGDTLVVALDSAKLVNFRKINRPDTITSNCKGKVWYLKINNDIEFYTGDGFHPIHHDKKLRPITDYIISKYALPASR